MLEEEELAKAEADDSVDEVNRLTFDFEILYYCDIPSGSLML